MNTKPQFVARPLERLFRLDEASVLLRRSTCTLRRDIKAGRLKCIRLGRRILIDAAELRRIMQEARSHTQRLPVEHVSVAGENRGGC